MAHKTSLPLDWHIQRWMNGVMLTKNARATQSMAIHSMIGSTLGIFAYNTDHETIFTNTSITKAHGFLSEQDGLGRTPFAWADKKSASELIHNNHHVLKDCKTFIKDEGFIRTDGYIIQATSVKIPLYNEKQKIMGVMGFSIIVDKNFGVTTFSEGLVELLKTNVIAGFPLQTRSHQQPARLSQRQLDCLHLLSKGMTYKKIAEKLNLSPKTIEHYIENLKTKLDCKDRSALIIAAQEMGIT